MAAVRAATRAPFLEGEPRRALLGLVEKHGVDQVLGWLPGAPPGLKVPRLVAWLVERPHQPPAELLEGLAERDEAAEATEPATERPAAFSGFGHERAAPPVTEATRRAARDALKSSPSEPEAARMSNKPGGA